MILWQTVWAKNLLQFFGIEANILKEREKVELVFEFVLCCIMLG